MSKIVGMVIFSKSSVEHISRPIFEGYQTFKVPCDKSIRNWLKRVCNHVCHRL